MDPLAHFLWPRCWIFIQSLKRILIYSLPVVDLLSFLFMRHLHWIDAVLFSRWIWRFSRFIWLKKLFLHLKTLYTPLLHICAKIKSGQVCSFKNGRSICILCSPQSCINPQHSSTQGFPFCFTWLALLDYSRFHLTAASERGTAPI